MGKILAKLMGYRFVDLDAVVEKRAGRTVAQIFQTEGEPAFRAQESACLLELGRRTGIVIAAGGGAPLQEANRDFFLSSARTFFLDVPLETAVRRVGRNDPSRPLLSIDDAGLTALYESRLPVYSSLGTQVDCTGKSPQEIAEEIREAARSTRPGRRSARQSDG